MSFLNSVVLPKDTSGLEPVKTPAIKSGFLASVQLPNDQVRANTVAQIATDANAAKIEAEKQGGILGTLKQAASEFVKPFTEAFSKDKAFSNILVDTTGKVPALEAGWQNLSSTIADAGERVANAGFTIADEHKSLLDKGVSVGEAGMGIINSVFTPITASLAAMSKVPLVGYVADTINGLFNFIGSGGSTLASNVVNNLPVSQEVKDKISPLAQEVGGLAALIIAGKATTIEFSKFTEKTKALTDVIKTEVVPENIVPVEKAPAGGIAPQVKGGFLENVQAPETVSMAPKEVKPSAPVSAETVPAGEVVQKPSKIGESIEQKAIEQKLTEGFEGTAGYDVITIKDQANRAAELVTGNIEQAKAIVRGEAPLPEGLRGTSLITAMEEHIRKTGDTKAAYELANSPLVSETSYAAQELRLAAERIPDSFTAKVQEIKRARQANIEKKGGMQKQTKQVVEEIGTEIKKVSSKRPSWEEFINEVKCNF